MSETVEQLQARLAAVEAERDEARETIATLRDAYREAIGVPESEHQRRRMNALAERLEATLVGRDEARAKVADAWDEGATKASPYGGAYLRSLLIENPYRAALAADPAHDPTPACEVHVPGRDRPSPWCASCRMSDPAPDTTTEADAATLRVVAEELIRRDLTNMAGMVRRVADRLDPAPDTMEGDH